VTTKQRSRTARPKLSVRDALQLLRVLREETLDAPELMDALDVSRATLFRLLRDMRDDLGVAIDHDESLGGYRIADWGVINPKRL
jgi:DNA-binding IclR family transcriptional regulator